MNAIYVFLIFASWSSWCDNETPVEDFNKIINSSEKTENIINAIHINGRTYKRVIKELLDAEFIYEIKEYTYYINPYIATHGEGTAIRAFRQYCYDKGIFLDFVGADSLAKNPADEKHTCLFF